MLPTFDVDALRLTSDTRIGIVGLRRAGKTHLAGLLVEGLAPDQKAVVLTCHDSTAERYPGCVILEVTHDNSRQVILEVKRLESHGLGVVVIDEEYIWLEMLNDDARRSLRGLSSGLIINMQHSIHEVVTFCQYVFIFRTKINEHIDRLFAQLPLACSREEFKRDLTEATDSAHGCLVVTRSTGVMSAYRTKEPEEARGISCPTPACATESVSDLLVSRPCAQKAHASKWKPY